jgi:hypothetical protein
MLGWMGGAGSSMTVRPWTIWCMAWRCLAWSPSARLRVLNVALDEVEKTDAEMSQDREITMLLNARADGVQELAVLWLR